VLTNLLTTTSSKLVSIENHHKIFISKENITKVQNKSEQVYNEKTMTITIKI